MTSPGGEPDLRAHLLKEGDVVLGKYRIVRFLGEGGMGVVYAAHHVMLDRPVAIKVLARHAVLNQEALARFLNEARNAARIDSEYVCRVIDLGVLPQGEPYIAMELLVGTELSHLAASHGRLPVVEAVGYVIQALTGIGEAHAMGVVHRDLKPSNLLVTRKPDGRMVVKVLDFGISKAQGPSGLQRAITSNNSIVGSPAYMSPEQAKSSPAVDARADIWAVGVILYELLTGTLPFGAPSVAEILVGILGKAPPPVTALRPDVPPGLAAVIARCLEKDPERRFAGAADLARALAPFGPWSQPGAHVGSMTGTGPAAVLQVPPPEGSTQAPTATLPVVTPLRTASTWTQKGGAHAAASASSSRAAVLTGAVLGTVFVAVMLAVFGPWKSAAVPAPGASAVPAVDPLPSTATTTTAAPSDAASAGPAPSVSSVGEAPPPPTESAVPPAHRPGAPRPGRRSILSGQSP
jgi:eukaryotic-like serine/threonine-protein kinase